MRIKLLMSLLLIAISSNGIMPALSQNTVKNTDDAASGHLISVKKTQQNSADKLNGVKNSAVIQDSTAYSLLFRFIAGNQDVKAKERIRHYVRQIGLGKCKACSGSETTNRGTEQDLEAFIAIADEYQTRVTVLDRQVAEIKKNNRPSPEIRVVLRQLQFQKEAIVVEIIASLPNRLTRNAIEKVRIHISERVKRNSSVQAREVSTISFRSSLQTGTQSEYTDSYPIQPEQSKDTVTADSETGEPITAFSENAGAVQMVGVGVTEVSYESDVFEVSTFTTIATPSEVVISQSPVAYGDTYARAETIANLDSETAEEGEYTVKSRHRYKHDGSGEIVNFKVANYKTIQPPLGVENIFSSRPKSNLCGYGCYGWYYTISYSFFWFRVTRQIEGFQRAVNFDGRCIQAHGYRFPYAYYPLCPQSPFNFCRVQGLACGNQQAAPYVEANTLIITIFGYRFCPFTTWRFTPFRPRCVNTD